MALVIKYYSFRENRSGNLSKDYGWVIDITTNNTKIQIVDGVPQIIIDEPVTRTVTYVPRGQEVTELTNEDFNALDVSTESDLSRSRRASNAYQIIRFQNQQNLGAIDTKLVAKRFGEIHQ